MYSLLRVLIWLFVWPIQCNMPKPVRGDIYILWCGAMRIFHVSCIRKSCCWKSEQIKQLFMEVMSVVVLWLRLVFARIWRHTVLLLSFCFVRSVRVFGPSLFETYLVDFIVFFFNFSTIFSEKHLLFVHIKILLMVDIYFFCLAPYKLNSALCVRIHSQHQQ